jgi:hypothetical protein
MLKFDVACFAVCLAFYAAVVIANGVALTSWQAASTMFWCRALYSLSTAPFFAFTLPVLSGVLTHSRPTGFNRYGRCVPFKLPPLMAPVVAPAPTAAPGAAPAASPATSRFASAPAPPSKATEVTAAGDQLV